MNWQWSPFDALSTTDLYTVLRLRQEVFVVEQDCVYLDADGGDLTCHHLLGWQDGVLVAYLRAFPPGGDPHPEVVIGRVLTAESVRGTGQGRVLMEEGHRQAAATWGPQPIWLSAQAHLSRFYGSLGYAVAGPGYDEDGIPHLPMRRE
ncbi:MAG: ElaA protein [Myxococcota bacterium]|jgi:ElaA protein